MVEEGTCGLKRIHSENGKCIQGEKGILGIRNTLTLQERACVELRKAYYGI